ncbi:MAG: transposase [Planctomycetota bacterium]
MVERDRRVGQGTHREPFVKGPLCADVDGFSLHAAVRVAARDRERMEKLCRYAGRPAVAESRLSLSPDGRVLYSLKKRWKDGTSHVVLTAQVLMERLCALVPRPRKHLVTYHGVLAPAAASEETQRPWVVPKVPEGPALGCRHEEAEADAGEHVENGQREEAPVRSLLQQRRRVPHAPGKRRRGGRRYTWAELLRRVHLIEVLTCPNCGGTRRLLAAIHDPESLRRVLVAMRLPTEPPVLAAPRGPPSVNVALAE